MDIRFCEADDFAQILNVDATSPYAWTSKLLYRELFGKESSTCIGAYSPLDNELIGFGVLDTSERDSYIKNLVVTKEHRRKGIGSQILIALSEIAQAFGSNRISLKVGLNNTSAHSLYVMFGFVGDEIIPEYYQNGESAIIMSASLPLSIPGDDLHSY